MSLQVKEAYRRICLSNHPDLVEPAHKAVAEARFKEVTNAYQMIVSTINGSKYGMRGDPSARAGSSHAAGAYRWQGYGHAWGKGSHQAAHHAGRFSNGVVAAVIAAPLMLLGYWLQHTTDQPYSRRSELQHARPYGLLHPPVRKL